MALIAFTFPQSYRTVTPQLPFGGDVSLLQAAALAALPFGCRRDVLQVHTAERHLELGLRSHSCTAAHRASLEQPGVAIHADDLEADAVIVMH